MPTRWRPDRSGIHLARDLRAQSPELCILMVSMHTKVDYIVEAVKAGATDTKGIAAAIRKLRDFQGVMGTYSITENNDFSLKADLKKVKRGSFRKIDEQ